MAKKQAKQKTTKQTKDTGESQELRKLMTEKEKGFDFLKFGAYVSMGIILITLIAGSVMIMFKARSVTPDTALIPFLYILGVGWLLFMPVVPVLFIARKEIWGKLKVFGRRSRVGIFRLIGADSNENEIVVKLKGNTLEFNDDTKVIVNPRRATAKDGVKVFTYVAGNAITHDYFKDPNKTLKDIAAKITKAEDMHDIFSDPVRIDAKILNETFIAAQQTNPDILKKIIAFLTSKNILVMLGAIALAAGAAAILSLQANNILNSIPICKMGTIIP